jgi:hypothetical protein
MQIAFHIGANCTDEDRLLKSVLRNASTLLSHGTAVPGPSKYRSLLRETIQGLDGARPAPDTREILLDAIVEDDNIQRVVLCNDNFIAIPKRIFDHGVFYPQTEQKIRGLAQLFPDDELSFFFSIRNPAGFLQDVAKRANVTNLRDYLGMLSPLDMLWSNVLKRIRYAAPDALVYVWCNEDSPIIWEDLIRLKANLADDVPITGQYDVISQIVTPEGMQDLMTKSSDKPALDRIARHEMLADILEAHAKPDAMDDEIEFPELDQSIVDALTQSYESDLDVIGAMEGVELILPFA